MIHYVAEPSYEECVRGLLRLAREIGGDGFNDMSDADVEEFTRPTAELTEAEIYAILSDQQDVDEQGENQIEEDEPSLKSASISRIVHLIQEAIEEAISSDPITTRSLRFKYDCEVALRSYEELYRDISRRAKQKTLNDYFNKS